MRTIRQIREDYNQNRSASDKLEQLVMDGLLDEGKLTLVRRALRENHKTLTNAEKNALLETINVVLSDIDISEFDDVELLDEAAKKDYLSKFDPRFSTKFPSDNEAPQILILKRKAIRIFPDNAKVALYYAQGIDKYISIPFGEIGVGSVNEALKTGYTVKHDDGEEYEWMGGNWINTKNQRIAKKNVGKALTYKHGRTGFEKARDFVRGQKALTTRDYRNTKRKLEKTNFGKKYAGAAAAGYATRKALVNRPVVAAYRAIKARMTKEEYENMRNTNNTFHRNLHQLREEYSQINEVAPLAVAGAIAARAAAPVLKQLIKKYGPKVAKQMWKMMKSGGRGAGKLLKRGAGGAAAYLASKKGDSDDKNKDDDSGSSKNSLSPSKFTNISGPTGEDPYARQNRVMDIKATKAMSEQVAGSGADAMRRRRQRGNIGPAEVAVSPMIKVDDEPNIGSSGSKPSGTSPSHRERGPQPKKPGLATGAEIVSNADARRKAASDKAANVEAERERRRQKTAKEIKKKESDMVQQAREQGARTTRRAQDMANDKDALDKREQGTYGKKYDNGDGDDGDSKALAALAGLAATSRIRQSDQQPTKFDNISGPDQKDPLERYRRFLDRKQQQALASGNSSYMNEHINNIEYTFEDGSVTVTPSMAKNMLNVYNKVNEENKKKIEHMMNESAYSLKKFINFASRY